MSARLDLIAADLIDSPVYTGRWRGLAVETAEAVYTARLIAAVDDAAIERHDAAIERGEFCGCELCELVHGAELVTAGASDRELALELFAAGYREGRS